MLSVGEILKISSMEEFERTTLEVFCAQAISCDVYAEYLRLIGVTPGDVKRVEEIPFLPIELFKSHRIFCGKGEPEAVFTSSGTGGGGSSKHYIASLSDYNATWRRGFEHFYGPIERWSVFALLPSYLEREGSSLVHMARGMIEAGRGGDFYLRDYQRLMADMTADSGPKILLGVSYALLDLAELGFRMPADTIVMETGGMKGARPEMAKSLMHSVLIEAFGIPKIHSEYGMAELMSQGYSAGDGVFAPPPWMRVMVRELADPLSVRAEGRGGINIIDLANLHSVAFIETQDVGRVAGNGTFSLDGRVARSDIRGCNLLIQ